MTRRSDIGFAELPPILRGKVRLAWLALAWERLWPALWPLGLVAGLFVLSALTGVWRGLPLWSHVSGLVLFALAAIAALWPVARLGAPRFDEALHRLERDSGLPHRPASAWLDELPGESRIGKSGEESDTLALWRAHKARVERLLRALRPRPPRSALARRDAWGVRVALTMALIVSLAAAGNGWRERLASPFRLAGAAGASAFVDAWLSPPAYTDRPPILLSATRPPGTIETPAGSTLIVRVSGAGRAALTLRETGGEPRAAEAGTTAGETEAVRFSEMLARSARVVLEVGGTPRREWDFAVVPDAVPQIELVGEPETAVSGALGLTYTARDDYGLVRAGAAFERIDEAGAASVREEPLVPAPDFALSLPQLGAREASGQTYKDLTAHPWAGGAAELVLRAMDEAGQTGESRPVRMTLPQRDFTQPLARALVEQRRVLAMTPSRRLAVARALGALTAAPAGLIQDSVVYLGLRAAYWRLRRTAERDEMRGVVDLLWDLALRIEDGDLSLAARELRAAQEALEQALARDAPDDEIKRLMDELRAALQRYMQALSEQMRDAPLVEMQPGDLGLRPQDLSRMLDAIENMARSGARDQAREMLSQMRRMLENLRAGRMQQPSAAQRQMQQALNELAEMIMRQRELMDDTFRLDRQGPQGRDGEDGEGEPDAGRLAEGQAALRQRLHAMIEQLRAMGAAGAEAGEALGRAERNMGRAGDELGAGRPGEAVPEQGAAIDNLRQGMQGLGQAMSQGRMGPGIEAGRAPTDPLGRPLPSRGVDLGSRVKVPDEFDAQTVRQILDELRRRLGEPQRPQIELDYIDRLLRRY